tara:strand:- start:444 stop:650 length:207 start_codon:yes stop_codon:yes gene_type:complete
MKHTNKRKLDLNIPPFDLNKSSAGCVPCHKEALKIDRKINGRSLNEIKINQIKVIVRSIFEGSNDIKK